MTWLLLLLLIASAVHFFSYPEVDPDLWGHLFFGKAIQQQGELLTANGYSYTAPDHPWINHEWLAEVIFYDLFDTFGSTGLILFKLGVGWAIICVLNRVVPAGGSSRLATVIASVWTMAILSPGFNVRPQIFSYLFFAVLLYIFSRYETGYRKALYWIVPLMVVWVNTHGGFVAGIGAIGLFSAWTVAKAFKEKRKEGFPDQPLIIEQLATVVLPLVVSFCALFLNPYQRELITFLAGDLLQTRPITEWQPTTVFDFSFFEFKVAAVLVLLASFHKATRRQWQTFLAIIAVGFSLLNQRHIPLFGIAAWPILVEASEKLVREIEGRAKRWFLRAAVSLLTLKMTFLAGDAHWRHGLRLVVDPGEYPTQAADFLQRNGVSGNTAVPFDWGEYFIWKLHPGIRVSIDGRYSTAYPRKVIEDNFEWMSGGSQWRKLLDDYSTQIAVTNRSHPVTALMREDPSWVYIYSDPIAFIFVRRTESQEDLLARFREKQLEFPGPPPLYFPG
jgi:hypothetical protein